LQDLVTTMANEMLERVPKPFDKRDAHVSTFAKIADGSVNSVGVVCGQEMIRFNKLASTVRKLLIMLTKAIKGLIVMSGPLEKMFNCFVFQKVPDEWGEDGVGYPSLCPLGSWVEDFFQRLKFIGDWLTTGPPNSFWISGFFFPQGFMTGTLQTYSRKTHIAIDTLGFKTVMTAVDHDSLTSPPEDGAYVHGAFMQGARFERSTLLMAESHPGVLFDPMPVIALEPVVASEHRPTGIYRCPFYKTSRRAGTLSTTGHSTNFIVPLDIPSDVNQDHWIRRGVALLSMLDD